MVHSALTGLMVHGLYLGGVFVSIENGLSAGLAALIVSLQPVLTSTIANRWLGERGVARQWLGLALGLLGIYLVRITPESMFYQLTNVIVLVLGCELTRQGLVELFWR